MKYGANRFPTFCYECYGSKALYTIYWSRIGGEKLSYLVPTCGAIKGMTENMYWKPTMVYYPDRIRIMNEMDMMTVPKLLSKVDSSERDRAFYALLRNVRYQIEGHAEWNLRYKQFERDRIYEKHQDMIDRHLNHCSVKRVYFGESSCLVDDYYLCKFGEGKGFYDNSGEIDLGMMFHSFVYANEAVLPEDEGYLTAKFWHPVMKDGVIEFIRPEECPVSRRLREDEVKEFKDRRKEGEDGSAL